VGSDHTFTTHKTTGTWRVVHASDAGYWRLGHTKQSRDAIKAQAPEALIMSGDEATLSRNDEYHQYFANDNGLFRSIPHYAVRGNHDNRAWSSWNSWFHNGWAGGATCAASDCENFYSFEIGPVLYVGINNDQPQGSYPAGAVAWIADTLAGSSAQWKIVFMKHNPADTTPGAKETAAQFLMDIFEAGGVDLVLCGGNSPGFRKQIDGIWYQNAGMENGRGFFGLDISTTAINITYYDKVGVVVNTYQIEAVPSGNLPPVAGASATPTTGNFPLAVDFSSASSTDSDGTIVSRAWTFGDGGTSTATNPSHTYTAAGSFPVALTVTDDDGASAVDTLTITVTDPTPPPPDTDEVPIPPEADTTVYSFAPTTNYGADTGLIVRDTVTQDRYSFVRFPLTAIPADVTITAAVLSLFAASGSGILDIDVLQTPGAWDESTMTWNAGQPTIGSLLGTLAVTGPSVYHHLDLTSHVQTLSASGTPLSVALRDSSNANILVRFNSKESATNRPTLVVTYESAVTPPPPPDVPPEDFAPCSAVDTYRGCLDVPTQTPGLNGYFRTEKINGRWWLMTPLGHAFLVLSVSVLNADGVDGTDLAGNTYQDYVIAKYGGLPASVYRPAWANATLDKMRTLGFNTIGTFSHNIQGNSAAHGVTQRLPYVSTLRLTNNVVNDQLVGNLWEGIGSGKFPDLYHPNFESAVAAELATVLTPEMVTDPYIVYHFIDQADELRGISADHNSLCWGAWVGQPTLTVSGGTATNHLKVKLKNDMQTKYGTIGALNTAWGTNYTSFDSAGGYGTGTGFVDQDESTAIGPTYAALDTEATAAMIADCDTFVEEVLEYYATVVTTTVRAADPNHLITSPNDSDLDHTVRAFDGHFDLLWAEPMAAYELLTVKVPLVTMAFDFLTAERDSPLSLEGYLHPQSEGIGATLKVWDTEQEHCWMDLSTGNRNRLSFFDDKDGPMKTLGFAEAGGNEYNIDSNGIDALGCWFILSSRGGGTGLIGAVTPATGTWYYRRNGFGNHTAQTFTGVGFDSQAAKAAAWQEGVRSGLREQASNGDFPRIGANWWKWADNGWTYSLERNNWGLVTQKDNAYNGAEAGSLGADGLDGTSDDEEQDYGDVWTVVTETNTSVYSVVGQATQTATAPRLQGIGLSGARFDGGP
jgi:PKD repeat protein